MKYDPIMCMNVPDSVKTKDANKNEGFKIHKAEIRGDKLYLTYTDLLYGGKETESFTKSEAKGFLTDPWNTWEGNTKSVMMKFVKDSNTLDKAIRNCDYAYGTAEIKDVNGKWVVFHGGKYIQEFDNSDDAEAFVREKGWH